MELYVARHGPAAERNPRRWPEDDDRPLTREGVRVTRKAAKGFLSVAPNVDRILSSPAARALATARIFHDAMEDPPEVETEGLLGPGSPAAPVLLHLRRISRAKSRILVVGHEPTLGELIGLALVGEGVSLVRLTKAGSAMVEFPKAVVPGGGRLEWLLTRKQSVALGG